MLNLSIETAGENACILYLPEPTQADYPALLQQLNAALRSAFPAISDSVPAYRSLLLMAQTPLESGKILQAAQNWLTQSGKSQTAAGKLIEIPVCYAKEFAPDLVDLAAHCRLSPEEIIALHSSRVYDVYCIGFVPGFAFMGYVDQRIAMPRQAKPKAVAAGSVGIAGRQTGIYPIDSPGGWQIIGRTPLNLYAPERQMYGRFACGDRVQFVPISTQEFHELAAVAEKENAA